MNNDFFINLLYEIKNISDGIKIKVINDNNKF